MNKPLLPASPQKCAEIAIDSVFEDNLTFVAASQLRQTACVAATKKMLLSPKNTPTRRILLRYYPATYHSGKKDCYVYYSLLDESTGKMVRQRIRLNHIPARERKRYATQLCIELNMMLASGTLARLSPLLPSPVAMAESPVVSVLTMEDAFREFERIHYKDVSFHTRRSYKSYLKIFREWLDGAGSLHSPLSGFTPRHAVEFMNDFRSRDYVSPRYYNNALIMYKSLFNWFVSQKLIDKSPFDGMRPLPKKMCQKKRVNMEREDMERLKNYLGSTNKNYLAACMLIYYCLLRPSDLAHLTYESFDWKAKEIIIRGSETKNGYDSRRVIPEALEKYLSALDWTEIRKSKYVFSDRVRFTPGDKQLDSREFARYWATDVRPALGLDGTFQFYSLKDSGITDMLAAGVSPAFVQGQADHHDLATTSVYAHTRTKESFNQLRSFG